jgi:hypothetical protein
MLYPKYVFLNDALTDDEIKKQYIVRQNDIMASFWKEKSWYAYILTEEFMWRLYFNILMAEKPINTIYNKRFNMCYIP